MLLHIPVQTLVRELFLYLLMMLPALRMSLDWSTAPTIAIPLTVLIPWMLECAVWPVSCSSGTYVEYTNFSPVYFTGCTHGSIRLQGGSTSMNGRVEVCRNGDWGTVCHDYWSTVDSDVACRQLGFSNSGTNFLCVVCQHEKWLYMPLYTIKTLCYNATMFTCRFHCL